MKKKRTIATVDYAGADFPDKPGSWKVRIDTDTVFTSLPARAQRRALASVLVNSAKHVHVCHALRALAVRWRRHMLGMREAPGVSESLSRTGRSGRCQPATVRVDGYHYECHMEHWCPWCWARRHPLPLYKKLDAFFKNPHNKATFKLILVRTWSRFLARLEEEGADGGPSRTAAEVLAFAQTRKNVAMKRMFPPRILAGAHMLLSVAPVNSANMIRQAEWEIQHRLLAIVPVDFPEPEKFCPYRENFEIHNGKREVTGYTAPTRKQLVDIVGLATRYPKGLLGPAEKDWDSLQVSYESSLLRDLLLASRDEEQQGARGHKRAVYGVLRDRGVRKPSSPLKYSLDNGIVGPSYGTGGNDDGVGKAARPAAGDVGGHHEP
ncbi:MAG: hypothetical protein ACYC35_22360, partial [Pirellulales bacterium]